MTSEHSATLIKALQNAKAYPHPIDHVELVETHISWVLLTGRFVYKIKKPLDLGFLDFSTLEHRRFFCEEEVRLNRRLAPDLYLEVISITGTPDAPCIGGTGPILEYAVKMRQFDAKARLDLVLACGDLDRNQVKRLSRRIAAFHQTAERTSAPQYASPTAVYGPVAQNFVQIRRYLADASRGGRLERIEAWSEQEHERLRQDFQARENGGFVRECHGDLHLGNIALIDHEITPFDCIEFNPSLRWIDVMSEMGFLTMDFEDRGRPDYARLCLSSYLEFTGDYSGLKVLPFYQVYRAMVRAKVAAIRLGQTGLGDDERQRCSRDYDDYVNLAAAFMQPRPRRLIVTHGLSGSGKSTVAETVVEALPALRIRSDIERKRLFSLPPDARTGATVQAGIYTAEADRETYGRLAKLARIVIDAGFSVVIDATFLKKDQRALFRRLADELDVPFQILECRASEGILRQRIRARETRRRDASEANLEVLEYQLRSLEPLTAEENAYSVTLDTEAPALAERLPRLLDL